MRAVILSAGQGRRLLPWTHDLPKCLLPFAGRPLIAWQLEALSEAGIDEAVVVVGFGAQNVEKAVAKLRPEDLKVRTIFNPFYSVADNIASCWAAREEFSSDCLLMNGDVLLDSAILSRVIAQAHRPVTVTIDASKAEYDADDMKVQVEGDRLLRVGKTLPPAATSGESIGLLAFRGGGGPLFVDALDTILRQPGGVARWFLSAVDEMATRGLVGVVPITGLAWTEVDYPADLGRAEALARRWMGWTRPEEGGINPYSAPGH